MSSLPTMADVLSEHSSEEVYDKFIAMRQSYEADPDPDKPPFPSREQRDKALFARIAELIGSGRPTAPFDRYAEIFALSYAEWKANAIQRRARARANMVAYFERQEQHS